MFKTSGINKYKVLAYRILLAYVFYFVARLLFYLYNATLIKVGSVSEFVSLCYHGLVFDTTAIIYVNAVFILLSILPLVPVTNKGYQKGLMYLYFVTNLTAYSLNFVDFIYYRYTFGRSTIAIMDSIQYESNKALLFFNFAINYWHVLMLFILLSLCWIFLYKRVATKQEPLLYTPRYLVTSPIALLLIAAISIGGIRGEFLKITRPVNLINTNRYVTNAAQADIVLNTPFALFRTLFSNNFKKLNFVSSKTIDTLVYPIKQYRNNPKTKPNVVIFILESNGKEYFGSFNKDMKIQDYQGYTPFVDSLAQHSLIFTNAYANGHKSIHAMSSILAGIPSFRDAFTSSPYPKQKTESLVSTLEREGYATSFFHGAPNGSMGFLGYSNILGIDQYYGKTEYNNDADFDGVWGIWDEPFFQYFNRTLSTQKQPFMATMFSVSSHEPYLVPPQYEGKFPKGTVNIHQCIGYTDYALRQFFKQAEKQPWFSNTIFLLVGDHGNTTYYDEYRKELNKNTVMMMLYSPSGKYTGVNKEYAQQIDIYPTILDLIGYDKPFRSWGRSLINDSEVAPFVVKYSSNMYVFMSGAYSCRFDGAKAVGFYAKDDKNMKNNLIANRNTEMDRLELRCKAFLQDYMKRVVDKELDPLH